MFTDIVMLEQMVYENELNVCIEMAEYLLKEYAMESYIMEETVATGGVNAPPLQRSAEFNNAVKQRQQASAPQQPVQQPQQKQGFFKKVFGVISKLLGFTEKITDQRVQTQKQQRATQTTQQINNSQSQAPQNVKQRMAKWANSINFESMRGFNVNWKNAKIMSDQTAKGVIAVYLRTDKIYSHLYDEAPQDLNKASQVLSNLQTGLEGGNILNGQMSIDAVAKQVGQHFLRQGDVTKNAVASTLDEFNNRTKVIRQQLIKLNPMIRKVRGDLNGTIDSLQYNGQGNDPMVQKLQVLLKEVKGLSNVTNQFNMEMDAIEWLMQTYAQALMTVDQQGAQRPQGQM